MRINLHLLFQFLEKNNPTQLKELIELRKENPESFEKRTKILFKELELNKESFVGCDLLKDKTFIQDMSELDEEIYRFGGDFPKLFNWKQIKQLTRETNKLSDKLTFFFGDKTRLKGKLINEIFPHPQELSVVSVWEKTLDDMPQRKVVFFDEKIYRRGWTLIDEIKIPFYFYQFTSNNREYRILSEKKLNLEYGIVEGTLCPLDDFAGIGQTTKLKVKLPILFLNKWQSSRGKLTGRGFVDMLKKYEITRQKYFNFLFQHPDGNTYDHPDYFQELTSAFLLSAKAEGYPLHWLVIAKPGSGKSILEECIYHKFDEEIDIVEGSGSTIKALIPSFKGTLPSVGALLSSNRICVIDEFLRILMRVKIEERNEQLSALNPILEHKKRRMGSGNSDVLMNPSCRALMVSNPVWNTSCMELLCEKIDNSFLSRLLIWYQDKDHIQFIQERKGIERSIFKIEKEDWLGLVDYLHSFTSEFDEARVKAIFKKGFLLIGEDTEVSLVQNIREVYSARYQYHIKKLMDGIIKTRCLYTASREFKALEKDYLLLKKLWFKMLTNWNVIPPLSVKEESIK